MFVQRQAILFCRWSFTLVWAVGHIVIRYLLETFRTRPSGIDVANRPNIGWDFSRSQWINCMRVCQVGAETAFPKYPNQIQMTSAADSN